MISAFIGTDTIRARKAMNEYIETELSKQRVDTSTIDRIRFTSESWSSDAYEHALGATSLFGSAQVIILDGVDEHARIDMKDVLERARDTQTLCTYIGDPDASTIELIKEYSMEVFVFALPVQKKQDTAVFAFSDAVGIRDKKKAWLLFEGLAEKGAVAEEIHGTLFWLFKNIKIVHDGLSEKESGLHSFVYKKALSHAKKYSPEDVNMKLTQLVNIYAAARRGEQELMIGLERFVLSEV